MEITGSDFNVNSRYALEIFCQRDFGSGKLEDRREFIRAFIDVSEQLFQFFLTAATQRRKSLQEFVFLAPAIVAA